MPAFERLHPQLRHALVNELGWRSLRPVQELAIEAVLDGDNAIVLAPTAGGKTEASLFPVLSRILAEELPPVSALYVCPIRALLNNQEDRVQRYARMVGLDAFKWHGDVAASKKAQFVRAPCHVLMITPESLEVMLMSQKTDARSLFRRLSMVIIDEVHAFAADDRGAHLASLLERLSRFCGADLQRIGLSATVGNPEALGEWLRGSSQRAFRRVDPPRPRAERDLLVDLVDETAGAAAAAAQLGRGKKSLVFVESRSEAERVAAALAGRGIEVFIHHSAVSRADRALAERQFAMGTNTAIVCTSTMELGIDVGDLDRVMQVDAPATVASLLQRMGRTGRREGTRTNAALLCKTKEGLLQGVALLRLMERGWVEDIRPPVRATHVLAHQILALTLQEQGLSRHAIMGWVSKAAPFRGLGEDELQTLVSTMLERDILYESEGLLSLGKAGERLYGGRNFFELYAVFSAPTTLRVLSGTNEIGTIQSFFVHSVQPQSGPLCFRLAGRAWVVTEVEWNKGVCHVAPAEHGRVPAWLGAPKFLSRTVCQEMKAVLAAEEVPSWLTDGAAQQLGALRVAHAGLVSPDAAPLELGGEGVTWHTFEGGAINRLLAAALERMTGKRWLSGNLSVRSREVTGAAEARAAVEGVRRVELEAIAAGLAEEGSSSALSKFDPCLPARVLQRLWVERMTDVEGARRFVHSVPVLVASSR